MLQTAEAEAKALPAPASGLSPVGNRFILHIDEVPDPEIHVFLRVALASSLMGVEPRMVRPVIRSQDHEVTVGW